jgi:hypothetical protein
MLSVDFSDIYIEAISSSSTTTATATAANSTS